MSRADLTGAVRNGDAAAVEHLLQHGADPNARDSRGRTPLHDAVAGSSADIAACLLSYCADPGIADDAGRKALDAIHAGPHLVHAIRQKYHRFRAPRNGGSSTCTEAESWASQLDRNGIIKVSGLVGSDRLARLRREFEAFVASLEAKLARGKGIFRNYDEEEHFWAQDRALICNNAFKYSPELVRLCRHEPLVEAANLYAGHPVSIQRGIAMRYLPSPATDNDMFGWHHDMMEKRFKMMLLLTDVDGSDQHMSYVPGSHKLFHPYEMFFRNRCPLDYCGRHLSRMETYDAVGRAGDLFIFDSNGAHRGNRRASGIVRDVFIVEYGTDPSAIWGGDVDRRVVAETPLKCADPFDGLLAARKKWELPFTRKAPTWIENLPHVERWLRQGVRNRSCPR